MSRKKKALDPSSADTLSAGFTYLGSFPLAARGVEVLSQSYNWWKSWTKRYIKEYSKFEMHTKKNIHDNKNYQNLKSYSINQNSLENLIMLIVLWAHRLAINDALKLFAKISKCISTSGKSFSFCFKTFSFLIPTQHLHLTYRNCTSRWYFSLQQENNKMLTHWKRE